MATIVVVEGVSDANAVEALAALTIGDLRAHDCEIVAIGGATNAMAAVHRLRTARPRSRLLGLCDHAETRFFARAFDASGVAPSGLFVCHADLEDEFIRSAGPARVLEFVASQGELSGFERMQRQPDQRDRPLDRQLHRFIGTRSGRKKRYGRGLVDWLEREQLPAPLTDLVAAL